MITGSSQAEIQREDGEMDKLDDIEIAAFATLLGGAGAETVTKLMGNAVVHVRQDIPTSGRSCRTTAARSRPRSRNYCATRPVQYNVRHSIRTCTCTARRSPRASRCS